MNSYPDFTEKLTATVLHFENWINPVLSIRDKNSYRSFFWVLKTTLTTRSSSNIKALNEYDIKLTRIRKKK